MIAARWAAVNVLFRIAIFFVKLDNFVKSNLYYFLGAEIGKWTSQSGKDRIPQDHIPL
jgi:hypothetical protein